MNRFGFGKFKKIKNTQVNFKILLAGNATPILKLTLNSTKDIFQNGRFNKVNNYYKNFKISREKGEEISGERDYSKIEDEFKNAVVEFNNVDDYYEYKSKFNEYLIKKAEKFLKEFE